MLEREIKSLNYIKRKTSKSQIYFFSNLALHPLSKYAFMPLLSLKF